jgi:hypothetical protein
MKAWQEKAHRLIYNLCKTSYQQANYKKSKKHIPYSVPELAQELIDCLNTEDEVRAKDIFLSYEGLKAINGEICV